MVVPQVVKVQQGGYSVAKDIKNTGETIKVQQGGYSVAQGSQQSQSSSNQVYDSAGRILPSAIKNDPNIQGDMVYIQKGNSRILKSYYSKDAQDYLIQKYSQQKATQPVAQPTPTVKVQQGGYSVAQTKQPTVTPQYPTIVTGSSIKSTAQTQPVQQPTVIKKAEQPTVTPTKTPTIQTQRVGVASAGANKPIPTAQTLKGSYYDASKTNVPSVVNPSYVPTYTKEQQATGKVTPNKQIEYPFMSLKQYNNDVYIQPKNTMPNTQLYPTYNTGKTSMETVKIAVKEKNVLDRINTGVAKTFNPAYNEIVSNKGFNKYNEVYKKTVGKTVPLGTIITPKFAANAAVGSAEGVISFIPSTITLGKGLVTEPVTTIKDTAKGTVELAKTNPGRLTGNIVGGAVAGGIVEVPIVKGVTKGTDIVRTVGKTEVTPYQIARADVASGKVTIPTYPKGTKIKTIMDEFKRAYLKYPDQTNVGIEGVGKTSIHVSGSKLGKKITVDAPVNPTDRLAAVTPRRPEDVAGLYTGPDASLAFARTKVSDYSGISLVPKIKKPTIAFIKTEGIERAPSTALTDIRANRAFMLDDAQLGKAYTTFKMEEGLKKASREAEAVIPNKTVLRKVESKYYVKWGDRRIPINLYDVSEINKSTVPKNNILGTSIKQTEKIDYYNPSYYIPTKPKTSVSSIGYGVSSSLYKNAESYKPSTPEYNPYIETIKYNSKYVDKSRSDIDNYGKSDVYKNNPYDISTKQNTKPIYPQYNPGGNTVTIQPKPIIDDYYKNEGKGSSSTYKPYNPSPVYNPNPTPTYKPYNPIYDNSGGYNSYGSGSSSSGGGSSKTNDNFNFIFNSRTDLVYKKKKYNEYQIPKFKNKKFQWFIKNPLNEVIDYKKLKRLQNDKGPW